MTTTNAEGAAAPERPEETASTVLTHPVRVRILEILNERDMSPIQFLHGGFSPMRWPDKTPGAQLSLISYHFRKLRRFGLVEVVKEVPRRGGTEHVYRGKAKAYFTDKQWAAITPQQRRVISRTTYQSLMARAESAMLYNTFDARLDRWLVYTQLQLDEQGWSELTAEMSGTYAVVEQIKHDSDKRLQESGEESISATFGMMGFESPQPYEGK